VSNSQVEDLPAIEAAATIEGTPRRPTVVIEPGHGWLRTNWAEWWAFRDLLYILAWRSVKVRYKQAVLGGLWAILQPLVAATIFAIVFGRVLKVQPEHVPSFLFAYAGLLPWLFFASIVMGAASSLVDNAQLMTKIYFPRILIPFSVAGHTLIDLTIGSLVLGPALAYYGVVPGPSALLLPLIVLGILVCGLGCGVFLAALTVKYRDFRFVVPFMMQIWLFVTPVIYDLERVPERFHWIIAINPMTGLISGFRGCLLGLPWDATNMAISVSVGLAVLVGAVIYFRQVEDYFADIV
jgi:lipopolysaccharide transport system permease protein